jgi:hypothetical protein
MARNIEIKARIKSVNALSLKAAALATEEPFEIAQDDTFFRCESGRLKLRTFASTEGELIFLSQSRSAMTKGVLLHSNTDAEPGNFARGIELGLWSGRPSCKTPNLVSRRSNPCAPCPR